MSDWQDRAACRDVDDPEIFTAAQPSDAGQLRRNAVAKAMCASCPVKAPCAAYGAATRSTGVIFGGRSDFSKPDNGRVPANYDPRDCQECGIRFKPFNPQQKFCDTSCTRAFDQRRTTEKRRQRRAAAGQPPWVHVDRQHEAIAELASVGKKDTEIALKLGCSPKSVERVRNQRGIPAGSTKAVAA